LTVDTIFVYVPLNKLVTGVKLENEVCVNRTMSSLELVEKSYIQNKPQHTRIT